jgi:hypothetical protein
MEINNFCSQRKGRLPWMMKMVILAFWLGTILGCSVLGGDAGGSLLIQSLSQPLEGATGARLTLDPGDGNLTIDGAAVSGDVLVNGTLEYWEKIGPPESSMDADSEKAVLVLKAKGGQPVSHLPWASCNGSTEWQLHLNPSVVYDLAALTGGGNVRLDLAGLTISSLTAETGGGNVEVRLPGNSAGLGVSAKTGAGKVSITVGREITGLNTITASSGAGEVGIILPPGIEARIQVSRGNAVLDPSFIKLDDTTWQTPGYQASVHKIDINAASGAGKVIINVR